MPILAHSAEPAARGGRGRGRGRGSGGGGSDSEEEEGSGNGPAWGGWVAVLSRHPPLRSQGARHSQLAGDGGEPLLGAVPAQIAIAVSLEARLSRPATSRTPSPIDEGRDSSGQGTAPCSSAQHTTNESSARHKAVGGGSHLMPSNANLQSNRAAIMWSFQVFAFEIRVRLRE